MSKNTIIALEYTVVQNKENLVSDMDGEKVILSIQNGKYYNLGKVGGKIWELIEAPISVHNLTDALVAEYEIDQSVCEEQVISFLEQLLEEGLIFLAKTPVYNAD